MLNRKIGKTCNGEDSNLVPSDECRFSGKYYPDPNDDEICLSNKININMLQLLY